MNDWRIYFELLWSFRELQNDAIVYVDFPLLTACFIGGSADFNLMLADSAE